MRHSPPMLRSIVLAAVIAVGPGAMASAQTVSDEIVQSLNDQGFDIVSTRYTWLRRIVVTASNGEFTRELLITRGTGVILDDRWQRNAPKPPGHFGPPPKGKPKGAASPPAHGGRPGGNPSPDRSGPDRLGPSGSGPSGAGKK